MPRYKKLRNNIVTDLLTNHKYQNNFIITSNSRYKLAESIEYVSQYSH